MVRKKESTVERKRRKAREQSWCDANIVLTKCRVVRSIFDLIGLFYGLWFFFLSFLFRFCLLDFIFLGSS